jgi:dihydroxyacetone kinase
MELGLGVHGEPGIARMKIMSSQAAVDTMMQRLTKAVIGSLL